MTRSAGRMRLVVVAVVASASLSAPAALAQSCDAVTVDLVTGASRSDVRGAVEYEVIARGPAAFGVSVSATRRIWGGVTVDRWVVSGPEDCPDLDAAELGDRWYLLIGGPDPLVGVPGDGGITDVEFGALAAIIDEPVVVDVGTVDRVMAWLRVNWIGVTLAALVAVVGGAVVARRRASERSAYLF